MGSLGGGPAVDIDPEMLEKINPDDFMPHDVALYLADYIFPDCEAITILWWMMVIELPLISHEAHLTRLEALPQYFENISIIPRYHNGPLPNSERRRERVIQPKPMIVDGAIDETDHMALDKTFYPGTMLCSANAKGEPFSWVTAGVLVEREESAVLRALFITGEITTTSILASLARRMRNLDVSSRSSKA